MHCHVIYHDAIAQRLPGQQAALQTDSRGAGSMYRHVCAIAGYFISPYFTAEWRKKT